MTTTADVDTGVVYLTPAQKRILESLLEGKSNALIAKDWGMAENTVKHHLKEILRKLGARDRLHAATLVLRGRVKIVAQDERTTRHGGSRQPRQPGAFDPAAHGVLGTRGGRGEDPLGSGRGLRPLRDASEPVRPADHGQGALLEPPRQGNRSPAWTRSLRRRLTQGDFLRLYASLAEARHGMTEAQLAELRYLLRPPGVITIWPEGKG